MQFQQKNFSTDKFHVENVGLVIMHTLKLTRTHNVGNSCRYLSLIDCRRGFARPPRSVQYYGKFPTLTLISGLPVRLQPHNTITRSIRLDEIYTHIIILT